MFTEEDFQVIGTASPFKEWAKSIKAAAFENTKDNSSPPLFINQWHSDNFSDYLIKKLQCTPNSSIVVLF